MNGPSSYFEATFGARRFAFFSDLKALESIGKAGDHNTRVQLWLKEITAFDYTIGHRKVNVNGNAEFQSRLPEPVTEHNCSGCSRLAPVDDSSIFLIRACGLRAQFSQTPCVGR